MNYLNGQWAFIFDMDGLMLDSERISNQTWQKAASDFGFDLTDEMMRKCVGSNLVYSELIQKKYPGRENQYLKIRKRKERYFTEYVKKNSIPIKKGLIELLDLLDTKQLCKAVASSTEQPYVNQRLKATNLFHRFDTVVAGSDVANIKPDPALFLEAARRLGFSPSQCLVLEDSPFGVKAAFNAGIPVILVPDIAPIPDDLASLAVGVFPSLVEVKQFLLDQDLK